MRAHATLRLWLLIRLQLTLCEPLIRGPASPAALHWLPPAPKHLPRCAAAERPEEVAGYLVPRVRRVPQEAVALTGAINTTYIQYLTKPKAYSQILQVGLQRGSSALQHGSMAAQPARALGGTADC
jgi:hypothetical protein